MRTLVINLFAGPGAGKTTLAHRLAADLAEMGVLTEYVGEYAKELIWRGRRGVLDGSPENQRHVTGEQMRRIDVLLGQVQVIVTDSPALLGLVHMKPGPDRDRYAEKLRSWHLSHSNFDVFVNRSESYDSRGRRHTLEESVVIDDEVRTLVDGLPSSSLMEYYRSDSGQANYGKVLSTALTMVNALEK